MSTLHSPVRNGSAAKPSTVKPSSFAPSSGGQRIPAALTGKLGGALAGPAAGARLHADPMADRACKDLDTAAFTVSNHVYLSQGRADLGQRENQRLLAHELAHVGQQSTMGEPMIQRSKETYTQVINYDELRKFADEKDKDKYENYIPDRAYRNERVAGRNYVDRNRGLSKSMDLYLDHVLDDLEAQQFFDPKNHEGLVKAYVDMVNGGAAKLAEICAEVEDLEKNYAHTIDLLEGIRQSDPAVELRKKIKKLQRSYDKVSSRSHEALGGNSYKKMIGREKQYIAWEQRNRESGDESRADLFARKRTDLREGKVTDEGVRSGKGLNLVEQELGEIEREKSSAELQHQDMYREMIAMLGYAAIELEKAGKSVTEQKIAMQAAGFEFNSQKEDVKRRYSIPGRLRSMLTPYDEKAVAEDGAPLTYHRRPGCPKIKTSPRPESSAARSIQAF